MSIEQVWVKEFTATLATHHDEACRAWSDTTCPDWTKIVTTCAVKATQETLNELGITEPRTAAKGNRDHPYGRSEYLTIDVIGYDDSGWGPPRVAVELENWPRIKDCAWKVLSVRADLRVLVCYTKSEGKFPRNVEDAIGRVRDVIKDHQGQHLLLVVGDADREVDSAEKWPELFEAHSLP